MVKKKNTKKTKTKILVKKQEFVKKEKPVEAKNKFDFKLLITAVIIILALVFIYFNFFYSPYTYVINRGGVTYYSNVFTPSESFSQLKQSEKVYVSPFLEENNASVFFTNSMNLWQVVLIGNNIMPIQLIRVKTNNELVYCYTNYGSVFDSNQISVDECNQILNNNENFVILIEEGNTSVILESNKIIVSSSEGQTSQLNFNILKEIFPNAQNILDMVNQKIYGIN